MLCDNCGKREANVRYSENINGVKKELHLCEECSRKLGIDDINFNMPIDFSSFFGEFLEDFSTPEFMPLLQNVKELKCKECGNSFEDIVNTGKFGCESCYSTFEDKIDPILKRIQGSNRHVGRIGKIIDKKIEEKFDNSDKNENIMKKEEQKNDKEKNKLETLKENLKVAIKEERYEDAAKLRDEIKKIEK